MTDYSAEDQRRLGEILEPTRKLPSAPQLFEDRRGEVPSPLDMRPNQGQDDNAILSWLLGQMALREGLPATPLEREAGLEDIRRQGDIRVRSTPPSMRGR